MIYDNKPFRELIKEMDSLSSKYGNVHVFEDLLNMIVYGFCVNGGLPRWEYSKDESGRFKKMFSLLAETADVELEKGSLKWVDVPGNIHQNVIYRKGGKGFLGQYFTPEHICDLMSFMSCDKEQFKTGNSVNDCCCGSGRMLLAAFSHAKENDALIYCAAKDIDPLCVKMCTANFLLNGVVGEVVCGNGLDPADGRMCFRVNEKLYDPESELFGIPHCRAVDYKDTLQGRGINAKA